MEKVLNQNEIDAMVRAARSGAIPQPAPGKTLTIEVWDIQKAGQIGPIQMRALQQLHERFALGLSHAISAYLRVGFEVALVSAEHLRYREFLQSFPEGSYLASCALSPLAATAVLEIDSVLAFPVIDLLLGGEGKSPAPSRDVTSVEEQIIEEVVRIICRELQAVWQVLPLQFSLQQRELASQAERLMSSDQRVLALSFEIRIGEIRGTLNIAVPAVASYALIRKIAGDTACTRPRNSAESRARLQQRLLACPLEAEGAVTSIPIFLRELMALVPGDLLVLSHAADSKATLMVEGKPLFSASMARHGDRRVVQLLEPISLDSNKEAA